MGRISGLLALLAAILFGWVMSWDKPTAGGIWSGQSTNERQSPLLANARPLGEFVAEQTHSPPLLWCKQTQLANVVWRGTAADANSQASFGRARDDHGFSRVNAWDNSLFWMNILLLI
jgi:hypothetical protein